MEEKIHNAEISVKVQGEFITDNVKHFEEKFNELLKNNNIKFIGNIQLIEFNEYTELLE